MKNATEVVAYDRAHISGLILGTKKDGERDDDDDDLIQSPPLVLTAIAWLAHPASHHFCLTRGLRNRQDAHRNILFMECTVGKDFVLVKTMSDVPFSGGQAEIASL